MKKSIYIILCILPSLGIAHELSDQPSILKQWETLLAQRCDLDLAHIRTPIEARVLRNAPYAMQGYVFKSPELTALFSADGGWYLPNPNAKPKFKPVVSQCIKTLKNREKELREKLKWRKDQFESRVTGLHSIFLELRKNTHLMQTPILKRTITESDGTVQWDLVDLCGTDDSGEEICAGPQLICSPEKCEWFYPG